MKSLFLSILLAFIPLLSNAHDYFFGFAELEYNAVSERIEATVTLTTHDFELAMEESGQKIENVATINAEEKESIEAYINKHFYIVSLKERSRFRYVGHEVSLDGTSNWYFESEPITFDEIIDIRFDLLMEVFEEQQNKVTLYHMGNTYTAAFTPFDKTKQLYFENKEQ